jgi:hypothetical protein
VAFDDLMFVNHRRVWWLAVLLAGVAAASRPPAAFHTTNTDGALRGLRQLTNGACELDLAVTPGKVYEIEASTNQLHWTPLTKFASPTSPVQWTDSAARDCQVRFYRVTPRGFNWIRRATNGTVDVLLGVKPGPEHVIETSGNLVDWMPWARFMSRGPVLRLQHEPPPGADRLFYRARQTGSNSLDLQPDGSYLLRPTQVWGTAYVLETSTNLLDWSIRQRFIGADSAIPADRLEVFPQLAYRVTPAPVNDVYDAFIILGQSNAVGVGELADPEPPDPSVWMFGNDYQFKVASEPVDDATGQVDEVSRDIPIVAGATYGHSWSLRAAKGVTAARGNDLLLIPCAKGSTIIEHWLPATNRVDRSTLFGSANYRRSIAAPGGLKGIWYYGHESSAEPPRGSNYVAAWTRLIREWRQDFGPVPVVYVQLAMSTDPRQSDFLHDGAEKQRQMETRFGDTNALPDHFMVVAFDLPLLDDVHLNRVGVNTLADRLALATREHVYGEVVNGTGPRLVALTHPDGDKAKVKVQFNRPINQAFNNYDNQFRIFEGVSELAIQRVERDPGTTSVLITLRAPARGQVEVSYGQSVLPAVGVGLPNVVKDADGLPAPRFRRLPVL